MDLPVEQPRNTFGYDPASGPVNATTLTPDTPDTPSGPAGDEGDDDGPAVILARATARRATPADDPTH